MLGQRLVAPRLARPACSGRDWVTRCLWQRQDEFDDEVVYGPLEVGDCCKAGAFTDTPKMSVHIPRGNVGSLLLNLSGTLQAFLSFFSLLR